jgi:EpsI family protein
MILTTIVVHFKPSSKTETKQKKLESIVSSFTGWTKVSENRLDQIILDELRLDDFINQTYTDQEVRLSLYIGYYHSAGKIGAAHDPMVCFPGQGWKISDKRTGSLTLKNGERISYASMMGQLGQDRELITYWFQSYDKTNDNTFSQKVSLFVKKLMGHGEDNAFVRITLPIGSEPLSKYQEKTSEFIEVFYPIFLDFIKAD